MSSFFSIYFLSSAFRLVYVCVQVQVTSVVQRKGMPASEEVYVVQLPVAAYVYFTARIEKGPLPCLTLVLHTCFPFRPFPFPCCILAFCGRYIRHLFPTPFLRLLLHLYIHITRRKRGASTVCFEAAPSPPQREI